MPAEAFLFDQSFLIPDSQKGSLHSSMLRIYAYMLFSLSIGSAFLLQATHLPLYLVWLAAASVGAGALLANLTRIRTTGMSVGIAGLILVYYIAPEPSIRLVAFLTFLALLLLAATALLIAADLSPKGATNR